MESRGLGRASAGELRLLDAAGNRAAEGLRVLEDIARFVLDDAELTGQLKHARHRVRESLGVLAGGSAGLTASRDTPGDVGTTISTEQETQRGGLRAVALAGGRRAQEALRSLEELAKALGSSGTVFESTRYELYELERRVVGGLAPACPQWSLCVLVTASLCRHYGPAEVIRLAVEGGADCVQIREKSLEDGALLDHAGKMVGVCHALGIHAVVNDRVDIARLSGADGVHLGQQDLSIDAARSVLGPDGWIGVSCSTIEQARSAVQSGADVCGLGPVFSSTTKQRASLAGLGLVEAYAADASTAGTPHLAISGIDASNTGLVRASGGRGVAVSSAICGSEDPLTSARAIVSAIRGHATMPA